MTGPTAVQVIPTEPVPSASVVRSDGAPVSPEEFVRLLARLLHGTDAVAPDQLGQKIGEMPAELESESPRKPETPSAEQTAPNALAALAVELIPVGPPSPPPPPAAQDPDLGPARETGAGLPEALTPPVMREGTPGLSKPALSSGQPEIRDLPAAAAEHASKPVTSSLHSSTSPVPDTVSPPAREEEPRPPTAGAHATQTAPEARHEVSLAIGTADAGGFRSSPDGDRSGDRGRNGPNAGNGLGGVSGSPASTTQPAPDSTDVSTRAASVAAPRAAVEQVAERVGLAHREGRDEVSFRLEPPELGAVRIQAVLEGQRLTLHIRTEHEAARVALEQSMPQLRESLSQQGIVAGRVTIELGLDTSARGFSGHDFAGSPRHEPADPPARSNEISVRSRQWPEQDSQGVDLWV